MSHQGFPIVLTADRILMARYSILLDGMMAAGLTTATPAPAMRYFMSPRAAARDGLALTAPLGVRRVEAELLASGFARGDVAVAAPEDLRRVVGPSTRLVLISSGDPLGLGMNDSTMAAIAGGRPYAPVWLAGMMRRLGDLRKNLPDLRVAIGGPGAWQFVQTPGAAAELGIDHVFSGYCEGHLGAWVRGIVDGGAPPPAFLQAPITLPEGLPDLPGASSMGVVEVSRGCGLGCPFCTVRSQPMQHFAVEQIVRNVRLNVRAGVRSGCLISEDFLRYGAEGMQLRPDRVLELAEAVRGVEGLRLIQLDHVNVSSAARFPQEDLTRLRATLTRGVRHRLLWVNLGVETVDGELLKSHSCGGKLYPFQPGEWRGVCEEAVDHMVAAGFAPMVSLLFGMPGETEDGLRQNLEFVRRYRGKPVTAFPLFYAPVAAGQKAFGLEDMTATHWQLFRECYAQNFEWVPRLYWDNQTGAGVPLLRKLLVQAGGKVQAMGWKALIAWKSRKPKRGERPDAR